MEGCLDIHCHYGVLASVRIHKGHQSEVFGIAIVVFSVCSVLELERLAVLNVN